MKLTRKIGQIALVAMMLVASIEQVNAQQANPATTAEESYDPIGSMLDSLVTLNHVVRFNCLETSCFEAKIYEQGSYPTFSDEVHKERMAKISSPIPLSYNQYVKGFIDLYANRKRGLTQRSMGLSNLYFPMFEEVLDREGLPLEFKYLSIVESALNPIATSRVGATGIWQFMYATGVIYDLKVNSFTDDRRDPYKATQAACQYFKDMYRIYGDWLLVIAAYNCGAGNVNKAIKRSGGKTNFWEIMQYLPQETRGYVPAFIAVTYVMNYSREHNLYPITPAYSYFEVDTIRVDRQVNFNVLANQIDLPTDVISFLNPVYKRGYIPDTEEYYTLRLPTNKIALFMANQEQIFALSQPSPRPVLNENIASRYREKNNNEEANTSDNGNYEFTTKKIKKTHVVRRGETLSAIADKYEMTTSAVKKMNRLKSNSVKKGQRLQVTAMVKTRIPVKNKVSVATANVVKKDTGSSNTAISVVNEKADTAKKEQIAEDKNDTAKQEVATISTSKAAKSPKYVYHMVQPGDTLWNIAKRYDGVTVEMIKDINNLRNANIKPGTRLKVIVNG
jgi:membrane-bound lytic murein transglycosylase D